MVLTVKTINMRERSKYFGSPLNLDEYIIGEIFEFK